MLEAKRWLIVAAHYDDEALLFGDLLLYLAEHRREIHIAVLTDVAYCNPPKNAEQLAREPMRQACRLGAFARVCLDLRATPYHLLLPQLANVQSEQQEDAQTMAAGRMQSILAAAKPDALVTHAENGDYAIELQNFVRPRRQHQWAAELCLACRGAIPLYLRDPTGKTTVPHDPPGKRRLLSYYRFGCTQTPTWDAETLYPELVNDDEHYSLIP